ncbi:hypothetical protein G3I76_03595, partial [Streptomyces sp. SID11233]|nr:hypothetical protein [Streptomyces sp. SID11233]
QALRYVVRDLRDRGAIALSEGERVRAARLLDRDGRVAVLARLTEGVSCGFRLRMDDGGVAEWRIDVVHVLVQGCLGAVAR